MKLVGAFIAQSTTKDYIKAEEELVKNSGCFIKTAKCWNKKVCQQSQETGINTAYEGSTTQKESK